MGGWDHTTRLLRLLTQTLYTTLLRYISTVDKIKPSHYDRGMIKNDAATLRRHYEPML